MRVTTRIHAYAFQYVWEDICEMDMKSDYFVKTFYALGKCVHKNSAGKWHNF